MAALSDHLDGLRKLLREFADRAVIVSDYLVEGDEDYAFQTTVQLDGDIITSIHVDAPTHPDFDVAHRAHIEHVGDVLERKTLELSRWARRLSWSFSGLAMTATGSSAWLMFGEALLDTLVVQLTSVAMVLVGHLLASKLGSVALRLLSRRFTRGLVGTKEGREWA